MAKLILMQDSTIIDEILLEGECITIGRKPDNDIKINDKSVSSHHCQIITVLNDSFIEDLQSTNGTYINSRRINKYALRDGDVISIGKHNIKYINKLSGAVDNPEDRTMILKSTSRASDNQEDVDTQPAWGNLDGVEHNAWVKILNGKNKGKNYKISKPMTTLGKPGGQVAVITRRGNNYFITGVETDAYGKYPNLNKKSISSHSVMLNNQDIIEIGNLSISFFTS